MAAEGDNQEAVTLFGHASEVLKEYGDAIKEVNEKLTELTRQMDGLADPNLGQISDAVDEIVSELQTETKSFGPIAIQLTAAASEQAVA